MFISSTFNDMHAERDYLVKRVFPELQEWCERSKLQLIDVDLRWGITEQDAHNLASVKVCLEHIDRCRPFFVCLLGQRRGWVPRARDVSGDTLDTFPELAGEIGRRSVTELEILHAVVRPFRRRESSAAGALGAAPEIARHAFFYLRDPSYLAQLGRDSGGAQQIYTNESLSTPEERASADEAVREWREEQIPAVRRPLRLYRSSWDDRGTTPELRLPLAAPSAGSAAQWRERWLAAGVGVPCDAVAVPESLQDAAADSNRRLCRGRLKDFRFIGHLEEPPRHCDPPGAVLPAESSLAEVIVEDLKLAICERFRHEPARFRSGVELAAVDELERELEQQEQFLFDHAQGFVERAGDFDELDEYLGRPNEPRVLVLAGEDGIGKSTLLARWIQRHQDEATRSSLRLQYRFIGASDLSASVDALIRSLWRELTEGDGKLRQEIPEDAQELRKAWPELLAEAGRRRPTALVIDALNQLDTGMGDLSWL
ncbi:MAG TPA: AAA family ATPase, partial [Thermoanaerobaculia bacterium]|nr:AAA family ATPase [Thermoanaerobaculia bacterium]